MSVTEFTPHLERLANATEQLNENKLKIEQISVSKFKNK